MTSIILLGSGFGDHLCVRAIVDTLKQNQPILGHQKIPPHDLMLSKYGIPMYIGSHIDPHKWIDYIGFNGGVFNNEKSVILGGWPDVKILGA